MSLPTPESEIIYKTPGSGGDTSLQVVCLGGRGLRGHPNNIGYCTFSCSPKEVQSKNLLTKILHILVTGLRKQVGPDKEVSHDTYPVPGLIMLAGAM